MNQDPVALNLMAASESYLCPAIPIESSTSHHTSLPALHLIPSSTLAKLRNVGPARIKDMRALNQSKQIISHIPISASPQTCAKINDALHAAMHLSTNRFAALALLPSETGQGNEAASTLR